MSKDAKPSKGKKRGWYKSSSKSQLKPGDLGFLCSINQHQEKIAMLNMFAILNKIAPEESNNSSNEKASTDFFGDLKSEVETLKTSSKNHRYNKVDTGAKNMMFIKITDTDPSKVSQTSDTMYNFKDEPLNTRGLSKVLPVCKVIKILSSNKHTKVETEGDDESSPKESFDQQALSDAIKEISKEFFPKSILRKELGGNYDAEKSEEEKFLLNIEVKVSNCNGVSKNILLNSTMSSLRQYCPGIELDYNHKERILKVHVIKSLCLFAYLPNSLKFKNYNLYQVQLEQMKKEKNSP